MIKLLHISQLGGGGRERRMVQLVRGLDAIETEYAPSYYDQYIITFKKEVGYKEVFDTKAKIYYVTTRDKRQMWNEITSILHKVKPHIVHVWEDEPRIIFPVLWAKHTLRYKLVEGFVADARPVRFHSKIHLAHQLAYACADAIVSNSKAGLIAKHAPASKSHVIYNGFDPTRLSHPVDTNRLKKDIGITTTHTAIMCARFTAAKDYRTFAAIARLAQTDKLDITFLAVGTGELLEKQKEYSTAIGLSNIIYLGQRDDIEDLLRISHVSFLLTNPSAHAEGISNSILESMAAGVPVIATNHGGTPEIITHNKNGYLIEPYDHQTAYRHLINLIEDKNLYAQISNEAIAQVKTKFQLRDITVQYSQLYNSLL